MTGRVFTFDGSAHSAVDALLPFYVNGTLRGEELASVERHLRACRQCQLEVDWLRQVFAACAALAPLDDAQTAKPLPARIATPGRSRGWQAGLTAGWRSAPPWVRGLLAAQLAAIVVLGTIVAIDVGNTPRYQTLGASRSTPAPNAVAVVFDPVAPEAEIRRIVTGIGARIVDGPTATNAFVLELPSAQADRALQALRAEAFVQLAEPLGPAPAGPR